MLCAEQEALGRAFAVSGGDKFKGIAWHPAPTGSPILADVLAWIDCRIESVQDAGDHFLVAAQILEMQTSRQDGHPLVFYRGGFANVEL